MYGTTARSVRFLLEHYFREAAVTGLENIPATGGGVVVSWHPNGLIDPGLIFAYFPREVVFGARDGLFRWPGLGWLMRSMGAVPIYRAEDAGQDADPTARRAANAQSLRRLAEAVRDGRFACLFPEGDSHDDSELLALKTGAARLLRQAHHAAPPGSPPPVIVPAGIHYDRKQSWASNVLVAFHRPLALLPIPPADAPEAELQAWDEDATDRIGAALREAVHTTESWELHYQLHCLRTLLRAEHAHRAGIILQTPRIGERTLGFARAWTAHRALRQEEPEALADLMERLAAYEQGLHDLQLRDEELDRAPSLLANGVAVATFLQVGLVFVLLPPFIVVGVVVHAVPALGLWALSYATARRRKDLASIRLLLGALLFPAVWLGVGILAARAHSTLRAMDPSLPDVPLLVGALAVVMSVVGLLVALAYVRLARETARAVRVRLTRARRLAVAHLRVERAELYDRFHALTAGLDLPGAVRPDGVVVEDERLQHLPRWIP